MASRSCSPISRLLLRYLTLLPMPSPPALLVPGAASLTATASCRNFSTTTRMPRAISSHFPGARAAGGSLNQACRPQKVLYRATSTGLPSLSTAPCEAAPAAEQQQQHAVSSVQVRPEEQQQQQHIQPATHSHTHTEALGI